ncbi:hypothetical protein BDQ12DRAFT_728933 [Crucibulum laeve]|uniref:Uncharacterized protein n=1 Tax=Crucibulum laeve TaxID=68775 RepID=A0A5C3LHI2_9AGAR|nr:hypothetical protein BDQ12DRAFT_728933 [Crucibulum laeve]
MLAYTEEYGGNGGKRYVASAIMACGQKEGDENVVEAPVAAIDTTWLTHFLFIGQRIVLIVGDDEQEGGGTGKVGGGQTVLM